MKTKILYFCLGISVLLNIFFAKYIEKREPECGHVHLDTVDRTKEVVSDEIAAKRIAELFLNRGDGFGLIEREDIIYDVEICFNEPSYEWIVIFEPKTLEGGLVLDGGRIVGVRKDNGVTFGYAFLEEIEGFIAMGDEEYYEK